MTIISLYLLFSMAMVLWLDITRYTIPNWLVASLNVLYAVAVYLYPEPIDWPMALLGFFIVIWVGFFLFALRVMGGGDAKLLAALALWVGWSQLLNFLLWVAIIGGVFTIVLWLSRKVIGLFALKEKLPEILRNGAPVPYGVAIAWCFVYWLWQGMVPMIAMPW